VSVARDDSQRLRRLEEILAATAPTVPAAGTQAADPATRQLATLPVERIRLVTNELQSRDGGGDEIDRLAIRLLLNDYTAAVAQLRAVVRDAGQRIDAAAGPVAAVRTFVWKQDKLEDSGRYTLDDTAAGPLTADGPTAAPRA
jgi:hypothetical protein